MAVIRSLMHFRIIRQHAELLVHVVLRNAFRRFEKAGQVLHETVFVLPFRIESQPDKVQHQWGRQRRIAALPGELKAHFRIQKPLEMNEIPCRFSVPEGGDIIDGDLGMRSIAKNFGKNLVFAIDLARLIGGI